MELAGAEFNNFIRSLYRYRRWVRASDDGGALELGSHWLDLKRAACLMSPCGYWGNAQREIEAGVSLLFQPAELAQVINRIDVLKGDGHCRFILTVSPRAMGAMGEFLRLLPASKRTPAGYLFTLLYYHEHGMLYVSDPHRRANLARLCDMVSNAREIAAERKVANQ